MAEIKGTFDERFAPVTEALVRNLDSGADVGASVAVVLDGELVVDIWGGHQDVAASVAWERDTIVNVFSTTKTMTALCALILADRGELDLHAPVARYWPEFAEAGKDRIEVRELLGHTSGLSGWEQPLTLPELADWERCTSLLAAQTPWWTPGTASGYHALTQGYLIGEVVRRITGQTVGQFFKDTVADPLGADFQIGLPPEKDSQVAPLIPPPPIDLRSAGFPDLAVRTLTNPRLTGEVTAEEWWQRAEIPAANGHGNARSVATIQSIISCGGEAHGQRLISEHGLAPIFRGAIQRTRSGLEPPPPLRDGVWPGQRNDADGTTDLRLGRIRRLAGRQRPRLPHDGRLRHEQDGSQRPWRSPRRIDRGSRSTRAAKRMTGSRTENGMALGRKARGERRMRRFPHDPLPRGAVRPSRRCSIRSRRRYVLLGGRPVAASQPAPIVRCHSVANASTSSDAVRLPRLVRCSGPATQGPRPRRHRAAIRSRSSRSPLTDPARLRSVGRACR